MFFKRIFPQFGINKINYKQKTPKIIKKKCQEQEI